MTVTAKPPSRQPDAEGSAPGEERLKAIAISSAPNVVLWAGAAHRDFFVGAQKSCRTTVRGDAFGRVVAERGMSIAVHLNRTEEFTP